jgi:hypothetical protein
MCADNESLTSMKPILNNKQQQQSNQIGSCENLQNLSKKNSVKHTAAAVADKNRKNETNSTVLDSLSNNKVGKCIFLINTTKVDVRVKLDKIRKQNMFTVTMYTI